MKTDDTARLNIPLTLNAELEEIVSDAKDRRLMFHRNVDTEARLLTAVKSGDIKLAVELLARLSTRSKTAVAKETEHRAEYDAVSLVTVLARAAVETGVDAVVAFSLSDLLLGKIAKTRSAEGFENIRYAAAVMFTRLCAEKSNMETFGFSDVVSKAIFFIHSGTRSKLTLAEVSRFLGYSEKYISRLFTKETGVNFSDFVTNVKINEACRLIGNTNISFAETANVLAFCSQSHFTSAFKKVMGVTPAAYRAESAKRKSSPMSGPEMWKKLAGKLRKKREEDETTVTPEMAEEIRLKYGDLPPLAFHDVRNAPFDTRGVMYSGEYSSYHRMDFAVTDALKDDYITSLNFAASGGRVRFVTDAGFVAFRCFNRFRASAPWCTDLSVSGFSLYEDGAFNGVFCPPMYDMNYLSGGEKGFDGCLPLRGKGEKCVEIYFPLHGGADRVYVALPQGASLSPAPDYAVSKPAAFFGSSITQGGSVSRPGSNFPDIISRKLDIDFVNLGLAGSCLGQLEMCDYICSLDISGLVLEYDANAPDPEFLRRTHLAFYKRLRSKRPDLPLIMMSRPCFEKIPSEDYDAQKKAIADTYVYAMENGDLNAYFVSGDAFFGADERDACTVDMYHSNDLGAFKMAEKLAPVISDALNLRREL